jgi:hypothetical protein
MMIYYYIKNIFTFHVLRGGCFKELSDQKLLLHYQSWFYHEECLMYMIMFVLNDPNQLDAILDGWHAIGVSGATIAETSGFYRRRSRVLGARFALGLPQMMGSFEESHYTLFTVVPDEQTIQQCLEVAEEIVGDLDVPHTGIFAAWELSLVKGVPSQLKNQEDNQ